MCLFYQLRLSLLEPQIETCKSARSSITIITFFQKLLRLVHNPDADKPCFSEQGCNLHFTTFHPSLEVGEERPGFSRRLISSRGCSFVLYPPDSIDPRKWDTWTSFFRAMAGLIESDVVERFSAFIMTLDILILGITWRFLPRAGVLGDRVNNCFYSSGGYEQEWEINLWGGGGFVWMKHWSEGVELRILLKCFGAGWISSLHEWWG